MASNIWELVKRDIGWQGGTIHQLAKETATPTGLLLADAGDSVQVFIGGKWFDAAFVSLDGFPMDAIGERWAKFSAFVPGFNKGGAVTGLRYSFNIRQGE